MMMKYCGLLLMLICTLLGVTQVHGVRYTKDDFMAQYEALLIGGFPRQVTNRTVMTQRCKAITDTTISGDSKAFLSGLVYSGVAIVPTQSVFAYVICNPFLEKAEIKRFSKQTIATVKTLDLQSLIIGYDTKNCELTNKRNTLDDCNIVRNNQDIASIIFNDYYNIRLGAAWGYRSNNPNDRGYLMAQHFAYASGADSDKRIIAMNTLACATPQVALLGPVQTQWCGFPGVYDDIETNAAKGKKILNDTQILNGPKILLNVCDDIDGKTNMLGCAINNLQTVQPYMAQIYNELWVYTQRKTMYQIMINLNPDLAIGNRQGVNNVTAIQLVNQIEARMDQHQRLLEHAMDESTQLTIKFEASYYTHLGNAMLFEINNRLVGKQFSTLSDNLAKYTIDRGQTQKSTAS